MEKPKTLNNYADLQVYVHQNNVKFWCKWGGAVAVILVVEGLFLPYLATAWFHWLLAGVLCLLCSAASFFCLGGYRHVTDPVFEGTVEKIDCTRGVEMDARAVNLYRRTCPGCRFRMFDQYAVNRCHFFVRTDRGDLVTYSVHYWGFTSEIPVFAGDRVIKFRGLPYPIVTNRKNDLCAVCGQINEGDVDGTCSICGHSIVK